MEPVVPLPRAFRILIVDAEDAFRRKAVFALKEAGHDPWGYSEVREGVVAAAFRNPDLILADFGLPSRGAVELFRHVRDKEETAHIPFLFYSRGGHPLEIRRGISVPQGVILRKPFTARRLLEFIQPTLRRLLRVAQLGRDEVSAGTFGDLELHDLLGALNHFHRSGILTLFSADHRGQAVTRFVDGVPISARSGRLEGPEVLLEVTLWMDGAFDFRAYPPDARPTVPPPSARQPWIELMTSIQMIDQARLNPFPLKHLEEAELAHEGSDSTHELESNAIVAPGASTPEPAAGLELTPAGHRPSSAQTSTLELDAVNVLKPGSWLPGASAAGPPGGAVSGGGPSGGELSGSAGSGSAAVHSSSAAGGSAAGVSSEAIGSRSGPDESPEEALEVPAAIREEAAHEQTLELVMLDTPVEPTPVPFASFPARESESTLELVAAGSDVTQGSSSEAVQPAGEPEEAHEREEHPEPTPTDPSAGRAEVFELPRGDQTLHLLLEDCASPDPTPSGIHEEDISMAGDLTRSDLTPLELQPVELTPVDFAPVDLTPSARLDLRTGESALSLTPAPHSHPMPLPEGLDPETVETQSLPGARLQQHSRNARREKTDELRLEDIIGAAGPELASDLRAGLARIQASSPPPLQPLPRNPFHEDELSGELDIALARLLEGEGVLGTPPASHEELEELSAELLPELDLLDLTPTPRGGPGGSGETP